MTLTMATTIATDCQRDLGGFRRPEQAVSETHLQKSMRERQRRRVDRDQVLSWKRLVIWLKASDYCSERFTLASWCCKTMYTLVVMGFLADGFCTSFAKRASTVL